MSETQDAFEQHFYEWLRGVQWAEKCRREEANLIDFINTLGKLGHRITCDYLNQYIFVDQQLTITMRVARETKPEILLQWVDERMAHNA